MEEYTEYLKDHIPKFGCAENSDLIQCLLVLGVSSFKSITEGQIRQGKSFRLLKKATSTILKYLTSRANITGVQRSKAG